MTKGNVFIGWSKNHSLAGVLKEKLSSYGFYGIVGGKTESTIDPGVGVTVINQMKKCSSAIMLFSPVSTGPGNVLSGNMLFELGYLFGTLRLNKVLIVYLDVPMNSIPSDLHGMWDVQIGTAGKSEAEIADEIVRQFMVDEDSFLDMDKLDLLSEIERIHYLIENHIRSPICYHDEMAQIVLLYGQAAYIFDDFTSAKQILIKLLQQNIPNDELQFAVLHCLNYFELTQNMQDGNRKDGKLFLSQRDYEKFRDATMEMIAEVEEFPASANAFKYMFLTMSYEYLTFANMMYCAGLSREEIGDDLIVYRKDCAEKCLLYCQAMIDHDPDRNRKLGYLFQAYVYRNMAFFHQFLGEADFDELFERSIAVRKILYRQYHFSQTTAKHFVNHIRMEYFLALSDNLAFKTEERQRERIGALRKYIGEATNNSFNRIYHIRSIEKIIDEIEHPGS